LTFRVKLGRSRDREATRHNPDIAIHPRVRGVFARVNVDTDHNPRCEQGTIESTVRAKVKTIQETEREWILLRCNDDRPRWVGQVRVEFVKSVTQKIQADEETAFIRERDRVDPLSEDLPGFDALRRQPANLTSNNGGPIEGTIRTKGKVVRTFHAYSCPQAVDNLTIERVHDDDLPSPDTGDVQVILCVERHAIRPVNRSPYGNFVQNEGCVEGRGQKNRRND
jgi:hypothetical protein